MARKSSMAMAFVVLGIEAPTSGVAVSANDMEPRIKFAMPTYELGRVKIGESVKCDFVFTNVGQAVLELAAVQPQCGCTTAGDWSRKVEPGKTGRIPIQFNASSSGPVTKGITVTCNDKTQPAVLLQIKCTVWKPVDVTPQFATFNGTAETLSNEVRIVHIVNYEETPLTLSTPESSNPIFAAELKAKEPGKEFELTVRIARALETGSAQGIITLKTTSSNAPLVSVNAVATLQPTVALKK